MVEHLLEVKEITKSFPGVRALAGVTFTLDAGEVCSIAGENGAGKSTLLAVLGGALAPDAGTVRLNGTLRHEYSPTGALADGIVIAHQEPAVVPQLTVAQNVMLGRTRTQRKGMAQVIGSALEDVRRMGFPLSADDRMSTLSPAQRHALTIARAFAFDPKVVALDEPTTSMLEHNVEHVLDRIRKLAHERGVGILYVSHKLGEVMAVSDSVLVLRDGKTAFRSPIASTDEREIVRKMVGRQLLDFTRQHPMAPESPIAFAATDVTHPRGVGPVSLSVRRGEVLGIAGLVGSGRTELLRAMVKADRGCSASLELEGHTLEVSGPRDSRRAGIAFIPEDRKAQGLVLGLPAYANIAMTSSGDLNGVGPLTSRRKQVAVARETTRALAVRPTDVTLKARQFSGGNQQKLVIAKWMWRDSSVYLFDEPTKGVDVGGRFEIYTLIDQLAGAGKAVIVVSSELPELITLCDRVVVLRNGRLTTSHEGTDINEHALVASAMGQPEA